MEKRFKNGLVLGKFMPPTLGHKYLIDTAAEQCHLLYVMICSDSTQPIAGQLRYFWLKEMYKDNLNVSIEWCRDENPQYPNEAKSLDSFYNDYWVPSVTKHTVDLDVVFTSEAYGDEFARYLGVEHVLVDIERKVVPISATQIRVDPLKSWDYVPNEVRPHFIKKVAILGPESTGKSTLTINLAKHFDGDYVEEYGRTYTEKYGTSNLKGADFSVIGMGHRQLFDKALRSSNKKYLFSDTEAITTKCFAEMYLGQDFYKGFLDSLIETQDFDLYILLDVDVPWVDDGTRDFPTERQRHFNMLERNLRVKVVKYKTIRGTYEERLSKAIELVEKL